MNKRFVLDASAVLACIHEEPGSEVVKPLLEFSMMSTVNLAESLSVLQRQNMTLEKAWFIISDMVPNIMSFDTYQAKLVTKLQPYVKHKGLSLGDRSCITLGMILDAPIYTADKIWAKLHLDGVEIKLIR